MKSYSDHGTGQAMMHSNTQHTTVLQPFFRDHPGEPVPEEKLLDFMVQGKIY